MSKQSDSRGSLPKLLRQANQTIRQPALNQCNAGIHHLLASDMTRWFVACNTYVIASQTTKKPAYRHYQEAKPTVQHWQAGVNRMLAAT